VKAKNVVLTDLAGVNQLGGCRRRRALMVGTKSLIFRAFDVARHMQRCQRFSEIREGVMKTFLIGLVIAIVFLATYFVSSMQRVW
jgi:hypothetical protein